MHIYRYGTADKLRYSNALTKLFHALRHRFHYLQCCDDVFKRALAIPTYALEQRLMIGHAFQLVIITTQSCR